MADDGAQATEATARERWTLQARIHEINPEPAYPLAAFGWADRTTAGARAALAALVGRVPPFARGQLLRLFHGRMYMRSVRLSPLALVVPVDDPPGRTLVGRACVRLWRVLVGIPRLAVAIVRAPRRMNRIAADSEATFGRLEAAMARHPVERLGEVPTTALVRYGLDGNDPELAAALAETTLLNNYAGIVGDQLLGALAAITRGWAGDDGTLYVRLIGGIGGIRSTELTSGLVALADVVRQSPEVERALLDRGAGLPELRSLPAAAHFVRRFEEFVASEGHRGFQEGGGLAPRWAENPGFVLGLVRSLVRAARTGVERRGHDRIDAAAEVERRLRRPRALRRALFRFVLRHAHEAIRIRENSKCLLVAQSYRARMAGLEAGRRLHRRGLIGPAEDEILFLTIPEIEAAIAGTMGAAELGATIAARRAERTRWLAHPVARTVDGDGRAVAERHAPKPEPARSESAGDPLAGTPASAGTARGPVRVVLDPEAELDFPEGAVLVAPYADTAWTPFFYLAAAVVVDTGSVLAHAATVAREFGVPCVVGVAEATRRLRDGTLVEVDGDHGTIRILDGALEAAA